MKTLQTTIGGEISYVPMFSKLYFKDMVSEQQADYIAKFAKETGLSIEESEETLEELNPFVIDMIEHIEGDGSEQTKIINWF
jgi:hypothetical protein